MGENIMLSYYRCPKCFRRSEESVVIVEGKIYRPTKEEVRRRPWFGNGPNSVLKCDCGFIGNWFTLECCEELPLILIRVLLEHCMENSFICPKCDVDKKACEELVKCGALKRKNGCYSITEKYAGQINADEQKAAF